MTEYAPLYFSLSDTPRALLQGMDRFIEQARQVETVRQKRKRIPGLLFLAGIPLFLMDLGLYLAGFPVCIFSFAGAAAWIAAIVARFAVGKAQNLQLPPKYEVVREVLNTLRDDQSPKKPVTGFVDLTGIRKNEKMIKTTSNLAGLAVDNYLDEWLNLKMRLYDGNILRLSVIETQKVRRGYYKRGASRMKWKVPKEKLSEQAVKIRIALNSDVYETVNVRPSLAPGMHTGPFVLKDFSFSNGILSLTAQARSSSFIDANQIAVLLRTAYDQFQRKGASQ